MLKLSDICPAHQHCKIESCPGVVDRATCDRCTCSRCSCGLPWDPDRGRHTRTGIRIPEDVYTRILAREGRAIEAAEARAAFDEADAEKRERSPMAIAMRTMFGLRFVRGRR